MSTVRGMALGVLICVALPSVVRADSMTVASNSGLWTYFYDPSSFARFYRQAGSAPTGPNAQTATAPGNTTGPANAAPTSQAVSTAVSGGGVGSTPTPANASGSTPTQAADALINFGTSGNYPQASSLTVGTAQPWYDSPAVVSAFGHVPTAPEQASFTASVLSDVKQTYQLAGLAPNVTADPSVSANHTISVVSGLSYAPNSNAIGITDVGHNGFGFIDKLSYATNPTDLAWAVAHNVSHELMHAFGVATHADQTGQYVDAATATWGLLTDPSATFSAAAVSLITATNFGPSVTTATQGTEGTGLQVDGAQEVMPVPEPATLAVWSIVAGFVVCYRRIEAVRRSAT